MLVAVPEQAVLTTVEAQLVATSRERPQAVGALVVEVGARRHAVGARRIEARQHHLALGRCS